MATWKRKGVMLNAVSDGMARNYALAGPPACDNNMARLALLQARRQHYSFQKVCFGKRTNVALPPAVKVGCVDVICRRRRVHTRCCRIPCWDVLRSFLFQLPVAARKLAQGCCVGAVGVVELLQNGIGDSGVLWL